MRKETLNITLRSQPGNNCLNVLRNLALSSMEIMPMYGKTMVTSRRFEDVLQRFPRGTIKLICSS